MGFDMDISPAGYSSFALSKTLYELSGWPGDIDWADWLPISTQNHPAYTCGYLVRQLAGLAEVVMGFTVSIHIASYIPYQITYNVVASLSISNVALPSAESSSTPTTNFFSIWGESVEDALTKLCIELWKHNKLLKHESGRS